MTQVITREVKQEHKDRNAQNNRKVGVIPQDPESEAGDSPPAQTNQNNVKEIINRMLAEVLNRVHHFCAVMDFVKLP